MLDINYFNQTLFLVSFSNILFQLPTFKSFEGTNLLEDDDDEEGDWTGDNLT